VRRCSDCTSSTFCGFPATFEPSEGSGCNEGVGLQLGVRTLRRDSAHRVGFRTCIGCIAFSCSSRGVNSLGCLSSYCSSCSTHHQRCCSRARSLAHSLCSFLASNRGGFSCLPALISSHARSLYNFLASNRGSSVSCHDGLTATIPYCRSSLRINGLDGAQLRCAGPCGKHRQNNCFRASFRVMPTNHRVQPVC